MALGVASPQKWTQSPLALGSTHNVALAEKAARRCGMKFLFQQRLKPDRAMLWMRPRNDRIAITCTEKWLSQHQDGFDPLLGVE